MPKPKQDLFQQNLFQINCLCCKAPLSFSTSDLEKEACHISCKECGQTYGLQDETLKRQLKLFAALCAQIQQSEEILGNASVAVDVGPHNVKIPFKLLLTRLKSTLDLQIGDTKLLVTYRVQPTDKK